MVGIVGDRQHLEMLPIVSSLNSPPRSMAPIVGDFGVIVTPLVSGPARSMTVTVVPLVVVPRRPVWQLGVDPSTACGRIL